MIERGTANQPSTRRPPSSPESVDEWSGDTNANARQHRRDEEDTPVGLETLDAEADMRLRHRVKETNVTTQQIAKRVDDAHSKIDRAKEAVERLSNRVGNVETKIQEHTLTTVTKLGEIEAKVAGGLGRLEGQVGELIKAVDDKREVRQQITMAHVDVAKFGKQTEIADQADAKKHRRERITKLVGSILGLMSSGAILGYLVTHVRC